MITLTAALLASLTVSSPAVVIAAEGDATAIVPSGTLTLKRGLELPQGAIVATGARSRASLRLASGSLVTLGEGTQVFLTELEHKSVAGERKETVKLVVGRLWAKVTRLFGAGSTFTVETENAVAGVRGTSFGVLLGGGSTKIVLSEGKVNVNAQGQNLLLDTPGQNAEVAGGALTPGTNLTPAELAALQKNAGAGVGGLVEGLDDGGDGEGGGDSTKTMLLGPDVLFDDGLGQSPSTPGGVAGGGNALLDVSVELR